MRRSAPVGTVILLLVLVALSSVSVFAQEVPTILVDVPSIPVVVALDTSRSLSPEQLTVTAERLGRLVEELPAATPVGVVVFADEPRWLNPVGTSRDVIQRSLREIVPEGRFTLLNDALYVATGDLEHGGVIVLATDGKDENSATTVEDVARHCESGGVRILTVGIGSSHLEKPLRRLSLLTGGAYLGALDVLAPGRLASGVLEAVAATHSEQAARLEERERQIRQEEQSLALEASAETVVAPSQAAETSSPGNILLFLAGAAMLVLGLGTLVLWLWLKGRGEKETYCPRCGSEIQSGAPCQRCEAERLRDELEERVALGPEEVEEVPLDRQLGTETVDENTRPVALEATRVLEQRNVLVLREPGEMPRSFFLRADKAIALGRDPAINSISIADPAMSARHLKIVPEAGEFYLIDLRSTNGSTVNGTPVAAQVLRPGDVIRAGQVELEFRSHLEAHN